VVTPSCFISEADFQVPEGTLAFQNGLYDMELEQFRGFDAGDHIRETIRANYNPEAECPMWLDTLRYLSGGDEEIVRYFQEVFGFLISSDTIRGIFYLVGVPNSGKNTLVCTLGEVLGNRWVANAPKALIHLSKNDDDEQAARRHLTLVGRRFVWIDETNDKDVIDVQKFKSIASHKTRLTARRLRQDSFDFENTCKVVVMSNYAPKINPDDHAAWSRVVYLPFQFKIPDEVRRSDFADDLLSEADGILAWCIEGWLRYKRNGRKFSRPSVVESQVNLWQEETTPLIEFVETQCALDASYECAPAALYRAYESWRERMALGFEGRFSGSSAFTKSLLSHYPDITRRRTKTSRYLKGIAPVEPVVTEVTVE
jgi:putative DNA primase/helicase